ncbi:hypothetical protein SEA_CEN1621_70 [Microbacterium phage Cen1621]|uniref:Uncharacterized protein n=1 Tax=Microbacterium phage Cen1621 TaxID=2965191 RepID=A0A9E7QC65_9CAUD|nr:hypothetical protein SEA_CEN1621_70 [Microbacterium phage Cen1621]
MTNNKPLPTSVTRIIDGIASRQGIDGLLDYRSTMTKAVEVAERTLAKGTHEQGLAMTRTALRTGQQRIEYIDRKLAELTAR